MKNIVAALFILFFTATSSANKIDEIQTDQAVDNLIHKLVPRFDDFHVVAMNTFYNDPLEQKVADSLQIKSWQKVDFDHNNLTDLLVYGKIREQKFLIAVVDDGKKLKALFLNRGFFEDTFFPIVTTINQQLFLVLYKDHKKQSSHSLSSKSDTLLLKFGDFIEPNFHPEQHTIEKISFSTTGCYGTCPIFDMEINASRSATYSAIEYNENKGKFKGTIDSASFNELTELINYSRFTTLKDHYGVNWTDDQTAILTVTYDNGKVKKIDDYGEIGTNGLRIIYEKFFEFRENQRWK